MFIDTASSHEIRASLELGIIKGVTTNPTILLKEKVARKKKISELLALDAGLLFVQTIGDTTAELLTDARLIKEQDPDNRIGIKVPITLAGVGAIKQIKEHQPRTIILGTAIYSSDQGILAGKAGCDYVAPYVNRMLNHNIDPFRVISDIKGYFTAHNIECLIMGASFKNTSQVIKSLTAGADTVTVSYETLTQMLNKELALQGVAVFNQHGHDLEKL